MVLSNVRSMNEQSGNDAWIRLMRLVQGEFDQVRG
jgi:hypothetical protein